MALALGLTVALSTASAPVYADSDGLPPIQVKVSQGTDACPSGSLCLYDLPNFNAAGDARVVVLPILVTNLHAYGVGDAADSVYCNRGSNCDLFDATGALGTRVFVPSGEAFNTLSSAVAVSPNGDRYTTDMRNRISSTR
ncbi:hypothetical protein ACFVWX_14045 [Streptomyces sp. NPDC058220]|uniref:hypothetical protein n=1 Tax=unclassified Streptomyces TaxID=2593676 RepID=UPI00366180D8